MRGGVTAQRVAHFRAAIFDANYTSVQVHFLLSASPLPFEADDILNNYSNLNLLQDIFDDDEELNQINQNNTLQHNVSIAPIQQTQPLDKEHYTDSHLNNHEPNEPTIKNVSLNSPIIISTSNSLHEISVSSHGCDSQESIRMTNEPDLQDIRSEHTPMPSPNGSINLFGEEEPIPSVASLLTDDNVSSPISQYSSGEVSVPLSSRKRRFTKKRDSGRLREFFCHEWIDLKRKRLKNTGKSYYSRSGKIRSGKQLGEPCQNTCKLKCFQKLDEDTRSEIFNKFWEIGDHSKQYDFISNHVVKINKKRTITEGESRRSFTYIYHLPCIQNNQNSKLIVCKQMFLNTLSCGPKMIRTAVSKSSETVNFALVDNRGRHNHHKTSIDPEMIKSICDHVNSFEPVDSHYCRKDSTKLYLDGSLSFTRMFNLYKEWYDPTKYGTKCESLRQYRDVVNKNINLSFHQPKKDQCHVCHSYKHSPITPEVKENFENHINNKKLSRSLKQKDKHDSQNNPKIFCATFDLQKVLLAPSGEISLFYYCKRLKVHNLSVFDVGNLVGTCYLWNEQIAMKGSNEIASCVYDITKLKTKEGCDDFKFWSDNCTGQNRNRIMFFMYLYAAKQLSINIKHTFLEKGHTQNEGDSIHATIEKASRHKNIYTPSEWSSLIRWAKVKGAPYNVIDVSQNIVFDFKKMQTIACFKWTKNSEGQKVPWSKIKQVRVSKHEPYILFYKLDLSEDAFENHINISDLSVRTRRQMADRSTEIPLKLCYNQLLPIHPSKKKDLIDLCRKNIIPPVYHEYYENLVASNDNSMIITSDNDDNE